MNDIMEKKKKVILELMNDKTYIPMKFKELAVVLNITKENSFLSYWKRERFQ